ncbi:MAG: rod shape-determining protein MreD [Patescibacteria group bacterium]|nr:rod shape-determining protein MreD [Patescibacteria group bacterium]
MFLKKYLILIIFLYLLAIFQESFLSHFAFLGAVPNLCLISLFFLIFFEKRETPESFNFGVFLATLTGIILDLLSSFPFGIFTFSLTLSSILVKKLSQILQRSNILSLFFLFLIYFLSYKTFLIFGNLLFNFFLEKTFIFSFSFNLISLSLEILLNFILVSLVFVFRKRYVIVS